MSSRKILLILSFISFFFHQANVFPQGKPYVILVSYDAFRWDYTQRGLTPNLDSVAVRGVSALSLRPAFPSKTFPNHTSIATGMYPEHHGIIHNSFYDPFTGRQYSISDTAEVTDGRWYLGESFWQTAERQGIKTASYFFPGTPLRNAERNPHYYEIYEHKRPYINRIEGVINWLKMPYKDRPHFITLYMDETDRQGHRYGPHSPQVNGAVKLLDSLSGVLLGRLKEIGMYDSTNVIFLSDHGMAEISSQRLLNIEEILGPGNRMDGDGPVMMIEPKGGEADKIYKKLKENERHFKVYTRENIPGYFHFSDNPFIFPVIVVADPGWSLVDNNSVKYYSKNKGNHGYDNNFMDMHGIFFAEGPAFKNHYKTGSLWNIDIYPLLCRIFNIMPRKNIDGSLDRIEFLLKEN
ncbi:MAG: ectonucleotide pyrophosphatase/phosphodiesterase [Bacteroidota bacterium]|jgi:predicted AlkP superfamily pyrophosphatase or phosphodiesterase|nr:alkaline phosphatase family protein [Ignavibacteria bacterium]MCU7500424.1 alkaline phosphatase family protein [Ignavibacteria bacterium]MCU7512840.1 alkaline phosphatase family protein [Ignavibacteria bacterium]MCU7521822.1 alkaline phosphatase family protein [Ignavibacteria bacterium]MCU7525698.1 alkaline phosphatase family protein [Ignavibacteria bacterium]